MNVNAANFCIRYIKYFDQIFFLILRLNSTFPQRSKKFHTHFIYKNVSNIIYIQNRALPRKINKFEHYLLPLNYKIKPTRGRNFLHSTRKPVL